MVIEKDWMRIVMCVYGQEWTHSAFIVVVVLLGRHVCVLQTRGVGVEGVGGSEGFNDDVGKVFFIVERLVAFSQTSHETV